MTLLPMPTGQRKLLIAIGLVGLAVTTWLLLRTDLRALASSLDQIAALRSVGLLVGATLANLGLRFVRFQYFLRRAELRRPERDSLRIFLGSLGFGFIPLLAGEIAFKAAALGQGDRRSLRSGALVAIHERVCDVAALSAIAALDPWLRSGGSARDVLESGLWLPPLLFLVPSVRRAVIGAAHAVVSIAMRLFGMSVPFDTGQPPAALVSTRASAIGLAVGLLAWGGLCITTALVAGLLAPSVEGWHTAPLFAKATLLGSATLSPGGTGVTGVLLSRGLVASGAALPAALAVVILVRGTTFWLTLALGQIVLILTMRSSSPASESHFDALSPDYDAQVPAHIRDLLVERKTRRMLERLPGRDLFGLDIGCGLGRHMRAMGDSGARVAGIDLSPAQARAASEREDLVVRASAAALPFASGSFDFAYSVNVLHHLASRDRQLRAFEEIARVLKPGGLFFLHEINVVNPLFRFYMGYVFPLIRRIDEGTELWIDPSAPPVPEGLRRVAVQYFTFVPDFLPQRLLRPALWLEARLERSSLARYSAHFLLILERAP